MRQIIILLISFTFAFKSYSQTNHRPIISFPVITNVHSTLLQVRKSPGYTTEETSYRIDGYDYALTLDIQLQGSTVSLDTTLVIACIFPDKSMQVLNIISTNIINRGSQFLQYSFPISIQKGGWFDCFITTHYEVDRGVDPKFYQETSNERTINIELPKE
jgi:hypothetical protein